VAVRENLREVSRDRGGREGYRGDASAGGAGRSERPRYAPRPERVSRDPFFDKPYEAPALVAASAAPAWEANAKTISRVSANIKTKRKVAALFKHVESVPSN
jgi:ATP-dependent RNA helicase RhlE